LLALLISEVMNSH